MAKCSLSRKWGGKHNPHRFGVQHLNDQAEQRDLHHMSFDFVACRERLPIVLAPHQLGLIELGGHPAAACRPSAIPHVKLLSDRCVETS